MTIEELINNWKLNRALLASKIGMQKSTFNNKLNSSHDSQFSNQELFKLKTVLLELKEDLNIADTDFNEALKIIVGK